MLGISIRAAYVVLGVVIGIWWIVSGALLW